MSTDFFDKDLHPDRRTPVRAATDDDERVGTISGHAISRLVEQKQERTQHVASAVQEIEILRMRQRELEKEKEDLESLTRKQESYEHDKREIVAKLERSVVTLDNQAGEAMRAADLIAAVRKRFDESLAEIRLINENAWAPTHFEADLNKAVVVIEQAQTQYKKGMSKISASNWFKGAAGAPPEAEPVPAAARVEGFGHWLKAGLAFSLPLIVALAVGFMAWLWLSGALSRP